jgi:hypothetical protein
MQWTNVVVVSLLCAAAMLTVTAAFRPMLKGAPRSYLNSVRVCTLAYFE